MNPGLLTAQRAAWVRNHCDSQAEVLEPTVTIGARGGSYTSYRRKTWNGRSRWFCRVNTPSSADIAPAERGDNQLDAQVSLEWDALPALSEGCLIRIIGGSTYEVASSQTDRGSALRVILECRRIENVEIIDA
jgi:hypothetical protein